MSTSLCPHCQAELTGDDYQAGRCPACGKSFSADATTPPSPGESSEEPLTPEFAEPDGATPTVEFQADAATEAAADDDLDLIFNEELDDGGDELHLDDELEGSEQEQGGVDEDEMFQPTPLDQSELDQSDADEGSPPDDFDLDDVLPFEPEEQQPAEADEDAKYAEDASVAQTARALDETIELATSDRLPDDITVTMKPHDVPGTGDVQGIKPVERQLSIEQIDEVTQVWKSSSSPDLDATMTLKTDDAGRDIGKTTLVVSPRALREVKEPATTGADYELLDVIGRGGMGVVYAARQASVDRTVALKMLKADGAQAAPQRGKFMTEAVVTGDLDHPNIVPIYELGTSEDGALFYSMKRVQGTPWSQVISNKSLEENLEILLKVSDAVAFAHANGVIHRDLKPENVMLGEFGEVLVMDWGLALATPQFRHEHFVTSSESMGGTPAYMAPEMASGPFERISYPSDVYLLGAILFEIVSGATPHTGKNVRECLVAAARNEIQKAEDGELLSIAYQAMATEPEDRYSDVLAFQTAIRQYQSHSESVILAARAQKELEQAAQTDEYQDFARATFAFEESLALWDGNQTARAGLVKARLAYAQTAQRREDFELGISLLDPDQPEHAPLLEQLKKDQKRSNARSRALKLFKWSAAALVATVLVVVTVAFFWIRSARDAALVAKDKEALAKTKAQIAEGEAKEAETIAEAARKKAEDAKIEADRQRDIATGALAKEKVALENEKEAKQDALDREQEAIVAGKKEKAAKQQALIAKEEAINAREDAEYEAYIARIGLASAKIEENAFSDALRLLDFYTPEQNPALAHLRHWEWGRLRYLCELSQSRFDARAPLDSAALSPDGTRLATAGRDGVVRIWRIDEPKQPIAELKLAGAYVLAVAFSPDGRYLATGSSAPNDRLTLWDAESGQRVRSFTGHDDAVLDVAFSRDGRLLASASYDGTAKLWDVEKPDAPVRDFVGHASWVWSVAFSPDEQTIVTASQDGTAILWSVAGEPAPDGQQRKFRGHRGPVLCAVFSPDGRQVASGGYDRRVLVWDVDKTQPFDLSGAAAGQSVPEQPYRAFDGHTAPVRCVAFAAGDHPLLVSGGDDNTVRVWDTNTGKLVEKLRGHSQRVTAVAFSPDDRQILSASQDGEAKLWYMAEYREARTLAGRPLVGHDDAVLAAAFSPNGKLVVTASRDRSARLWNASTGEMVHPLAEGHDYLASRAAFFPDGRRLLTAAGDDTLRVWDVTTGTQIYGLAGTGRAAAAALSHDGHLIASGGSDPPIQLWNAETGQSHPLANAAFGRKHQAEVTAIAFSPDDRLLCTGDELGTCVLWQTDSGQPVAVLSVHSSEITDVQFLPEAPRLLTASSDGTVAQWNTQTGEQIPQFGLGHPDSVAALDVAPDGRLAVTACADRLVRVWDVERGTLLHELQVVAPQDDKMRVNDVAVSPDGRRVAVALSDSASRRNVVTFWNVETGQPLDAAVGNDATVVSLDAGARGALVWAVSFAPDGGQLLTIGGNDARLWNLATGEEMTTFSPHAAVASASFSPDGRRVVTASWDGTAKIWDAASGRALRKLTGVHKQNVNSAVFSPDAEGHYVLTASDDRTACLWEAKTGRLVRTLSGHTDRVRSARFSPDGKLIVTASADGTARIWNVESGAVVNTLTGHEDGLLAAAYSADGRWIVTGGEDNTARLWDAATGKPLEPAPLLAGHTASVTSVAFSPDGGRVLTGSQDATAKLWDTALGKEILTLRGHGRDVTSVAFSPDGSQVLTGSRDGTAVLWPANDWREQHKGE